MVVVWHCEAQAHGLDAVPTCETFRLTIMTRSYGDAALVRPSRLLTTARPMNCVPPMTSAVRWALALALALAWACPPA